MQATLSQPKILVGTTEIAGVMHSISTMLQAKGYVADLYLFEDHPYSYGTGNNSCPQYTAWRTLRQALQNPALHAKKEILQRELQSVEQKLVNFLLREYDIFIFNGWRSLCADYSDLPILQKLNKKVITLLLGSEARPAWMQGSLLTAPMEHIHSLTKRGRALVNFWEQHSTYVVSHPPYSQFLEKPFIPFLTLGFPFTLPTHAPAPSWPAKPIILHAPSSPAKGTLRIHEACTRLQHEGYDFTFLPLINMPNAEVLAHIAGCSFVVDELYSDSLLGRLGIEAAFFGKPVVVGSKPQMEDYLFTSGQPLPPCEVFHDGDPVPAIRHLLKDTDYAKSLGQQAKDYLHTQWSSQNIMTELCHMLCDTVPATHFCNPADIRYFRGWGMSDEDFCHFAQTYITKCGHDALCISDKSSLLLQLVRWLNQHKTR